MDPSNFESNRSLNESQHDDETELAANLRSKDNKNQKLRRLSIDDTSQPNYRKSIVFSDEHPVKVTAKFDYIGGSQGSISTDMRHASKFKLDITAFDKRYNDRNDDDTRFPKIEEMAHFHYDTVDFSSPLQVCIFESKEPGKTTPVDEEDIVKVKVSCREKSWVISRSLTDFIGLDMQFHKCVFDRQYTGLDTLTFLKSERVLTTNLKQKLVKYMNRLSRIAGNTIWCGPILNWFEVDNKGNHLMLTEDSAINVPAVGAAHVIKRYTAQASDEISFEAIAVIFLQM